MCGVCVVCVCVCVCVCVRVCVRVCVCGCVMYPREPINQCIKQRLADYCTCTVMMGGAQGGIDTLMNNEYACVPSLQNFWHELPHFSCPLATCALP